MILEFNTERLFGMSALSESRHSTETFDIEQAMMTPPRSLRHCELGFTLTEVLVALVMSSLIVAASFTSFRSQQASFNAKTDMAGMQQNLRSAFRTLSKEIHLACYHTDVSEASATATTASSLDILAATTRNFQYQRVFTDAGGANPRVGTVTFTVTAPDADGARVLQRIVDDPAAAAPENEVALGIRDIEFLYQLRDGTSTTAPVTANDIRAVTISLWAQSHSDAPNFTDTTTVTTANGAVWDPAAPAIGQGRKKMLMSKTIMLRNFCGS